ncbi:MAG: hypothetical protein ACRD3B_07750, partial [Candidatus Sulfotelmatobacter sp.]
MRPAMDAIGCTLTRLCLVFALCLPAVAQKTLPPLVDGTVIQEKGNYRHDGPLRIQGKVKLSGIDLDLRGPVTVAAGADLELDHVNLQISDPSDATNGASGLRCEGPAKITIRNSMMTVIGSAHPIWRLQGELNVDDFQTVNSELHLDHVHANLTNFAIFELEISQASQVVGNDLRLVFLSTHTGDDEKLEFSDIPSKQSFSRKMRMGSQASADLTDVSAELFLVYVHGRSDVTMSHVARAQLALFPTCRGTLTLPHGKVGSAASPVVIPDPKASDCPFHVRLSDVNADTWDVYAGDDADLTFTNSVIDELNTNGSAKVTVRDSEVYADWMSLGGDAKLKVQSSTVGAQRLATERPDLATSQVRLSGRAEAAFDHVKFDCGIVATGDSHLAITDSIAPPKYIRRSESATVDT